MPESSPIRVAVAGLGGWGPNLLRCAAACPALDVVAGCDADPGRESVLREHAPNARFHTELSAVLEDADVDAVILATPAGLHEEHARSALERGKHVLVEKPLALTASAALSLAETARRNGRVLMTGHTFLYNGAVRALVDFVREGGLGRLGHVTAERLSLGKVRDDVNVWWNLAPHDVSILLALFGETPSRVRAVGSVLLPNSKLPDIVTATLEWPGGRSAVIHVSWLNPLKVRRMTLLGDRRMVLYDDVKPDAKLTLYDRGVDTKAADPAAAAFGEFQRILRVGEEQPLDYKWREPLAVELEEFAASIVERRDPLTGPAEAIEVVRVLEACQRSLNSDGQPINP